MPETNLKKVPLVEGLFQWPSEDPRLIVSKCRKCGSVAFPKAIYCTNPDCEKVKENVEQALLSKYGNLWTYTFQIYSPPPPFKLEPFRPYAIGMIDFPEGIRVVGMLTSMDNLKIGMQVESTVGTLYRDRDAEYLTWMFRPLA
jgi:uncharacterized OB-fold protein